MGKIVIFSAIAGEGATTQLINEMMSYVNPSTSVKMILLSSYLNFDTFAAIAKSHSNIKHLRASDEIRFQYVETILDSEHYFFEHEGASVIALDRLINNIDDYKQIEEWAHKYGKTVLVSRVLPNRVAKCDKSVRVLR